VRIFELGRVYASLAVQPMKLGGLAYGDVLPEQWGADARRIDFFDIKGDLERLFGCALDTRRGDHPALHPGQSAELWVDGKAVGWLARCILVWCRRLICQVRPILFEIDSEMLAQRRVPRHSSLSRFSLVRRDLAFVLDIDTPAESLLGAFARHSINPCAVDRSV